MLILYGPKQNCIISGPGTFRMASNKTLRKYLKIDSLIIMGRWKDGNRMTKIKKMNKKLNLWRKLTEKKH